MTDPIFLFNRAVTTVIAALVVAHPFVLRVHAPARFSSSVASIPFALPAASVLCAIVCAYFFSEIPFFSFLSNFIRRASRRWRGK